MASSKAILVLIMRLLAFIFAFSSVMVLVFEEILSDGDGNKTTFTFKKFYAYRYLLSVDVIGFVYTLPAIPFAARNLSRENNTTLISQLAIFADLVLALLFATGVGAGFGFPIELKTYQDDPHMKDIDKFLDVVYVSTGFLLIATICMAATIVTKIHALVGRSFLI